MEYAAPVWDPYVRKDQDLLESTQKFACKMMAKNTGYDELLYMTILPSLADRSRSSQHEVYTKKELKKKLVCAKGWYEVKGVLVYNLATLGATIFDGIQ